MAVYFSSTRTLANEENSGCLSSTACSKCICCPYGYHIDLDFVRYCEAVSVGSSANRFCIERREKKERRRKCQSMEFLLGLVSPVFSETAGNSTKTSTTANNINKSCSPKLTISKDSNVNFISELDLSDVVDDFEATLQHSSKSSVNETKSKSPLHIDSQTSVKPKAAQQEIDSIGKFDVSSIDKTKSNFNRPKLQVQLFVIGEEKQKLLQELKDYNNLKACSNKLYRSRSHSFSENQQWRRKMDPSVKVTRDVGISCTVMTRDVGVSQQQIQSRNEGTLISLPFTPQKKLAYSKTRIEYIMPITAQTRLKLSKSTQSDGKCKSLSENSSGKATTSFKVKSFQDCGVNTEVQNITPTHMIFNNSAFDGKNKSDMEKRTYMVTTGTMTDLTNESIAMLNNVDAKNYINPEKLPKTSKTVNELFSKKSVRDKKIQTSAVNIFPMNASVTIKPKTNDVGTDSIMQCVLKYAIVEPDRSATNSISLNSMNMRSPPSNYSDIHPKRMASKSVNVIVSDLIETAAKITDTSDLLPRTRDFGTSPLRRKFTDMSVGESLRFNQNVSNPTNYCDNCKQISKNLINQTKYNNMQNNISNETAAPTLFHSILGAEENITHLRKEDNKDKYENVLRFDNEKFIEKSNKPPIFKGTSNLSEVTENKKDSVSNCESSKLQTMKPRLKLKSSKEIQSAIKILNDNFEILHSRNMSSQIKSAHNLIQQDWFKISSIENAKPRDVKDFLDLFQDCTVSLLEYVVNMIDSSGNTSMHYAVSFGNFDIASILLDSEVCDLNKPNTAGYTAVMLAALADGRDFTHMSVAKRMFQKSDVNIQAKMDGQTALMLAVSHGRIDMTNLLLDAGAEVNMQDEDGSTALMCAAEHGHINIVKLLLSQPNCDSSILDLDGGSALKIALEAGHRDIGVLLYAHEHVNKGKIPYTLGKTSRGSSKSSAASCASRSINIE